MDNLSYGTDAFVRDAGDFPALPVTNMFAEEVYSEQTIALQSRPGLDVSDFDLGDGPVRAIYQNDGVLDNKVVVVSGDTLYADGVFIGVIEGDGPVSIAGYEELLFINAGTLVYQWDGADLTVVPIPDDVPVSKIIVAASRLIALKADDDIFFWSDPLDSVIDPASFATAERSPDKGKEVLFVGDRLILLNSTSIEFWQTSADPDLPFEPIIGMVYSVGCKATGTATAFAGTFAWVNERNEVCVTDPQNVISSLGLQVIISRSDTCSLWTFDLEGVEYLTLRLDDQTWVYNPRAKSWSTMESWEQDNWLPQCYGSGYFGSSIDGRLFVWGDTYLDLGVELERKLRGWLPLDEPRIIKNLVLRTNPGNTPYLEGSFAEPVVMLRTSRNGGKTWTEWRERSLGVMGDYAERVEWIGFGMFNHPGFLVEFRVTDPVPFRVSGAVIDEPYGGF